jgi:hypothetical protein
MSSPCASSLTLGIRPKPEAPIEIRSEHKEPQVQAIQPQAPAAQQPQEVPAEQF